MNRIDLFRSSLRDAGLLKEKYPSSAPLQSVIDQLEYLINLESGKSMDSSRLTAINIGAIAAREVEELDMETAEKLYAVTDAVGQMITEYE